MSRSIDLFIHSELSVTELAAELARLADVHLVPSSDPDIWVVDTDRITAELGAHRYADDGDLVVSAYRYALSTLVANDASMIDCPEVGYLRDVSDRVQAHSSMPVLLVIDLQYRDRGRPTAGPGFRTSPATVPVDTSATRDRPPSGSAGVAGPAGT